MRDKPQSLSLTESQAACLVALRHGKAFRPEIAIEAKLNLTKVTAGLRTLERLGLARKAPTQKWYATAQGKSARFNTVPDRPRRGSPGPAPACKRLLEILDRPMPASAIKERLGVTHQRVRQLLITLYAQGRVSFGDPEKPSWMVMRAGDRTPLLSREEERLLSAIPQDFATNATKLRIASRLADHDLQRILNRLVIRKLVEPVEGLRGEKEYRLTPRGLDHPQRRRSGRQAEAARLPVESDRVRAVLSAIQRAGALRIRDVTNIVKVPRQSINALMQYLKRKELVEKVGEDYHSPYSLTDKGHKALAEMTRRHAA